MKGWKDTVVLEGYTCNFVGRIEVVGTYLEKNGLGLKKIYCSFSFSIFGYFKSRKKNPWNFREWRQRRNENKEESSSSSPSHENQFFNFPTSSSSFPSAPSSSPSFPDASCPHVKSSWLIKIENIENITCSVPEWSQLIQNGGIKLIENKTEIPNHKVPLRHSDQSGQVQTGSQFSPR